MKIRDRKCKVFLFVLSKKKRFPGCRILITSRLGFYLKPVNHTEEIKAWQQKYQKYMWKLADKRKQQIKWSKITEDFVQM